MKNFICKICQCVRRNKFWLLATMFAVAAIVLYPDPEAKGFCLGYTFASGIAFGISLCEE